MDALSDGPRVYLEGTLLPRHQRGVQYVEGMEGRHPFDEIVLTEAVQRTHGEAAGVDLGSLFEEGLDLVVDGQMSGEGFLADSREATRSRGEQDARAVEDDRDIEPFADEAGGREEVDQGHRSLVGHGVDKDERLL